MATQPRQTIALIDLAVDCGPPVSRMEHAARRLDGLTLLEWCIRRLSESTLIDSIVITGSPEQQTQISRIGLCNARWISSVQTAPYQRAAEIAAETCADWIVFASPTCPFMDPTLIDRLISRGLADPSADFIGFVSRHCPTFSLQSLGLVAEMCSSRALEKLLRENVQADPLDVPELIRLHSSMFQMKLIPLPDELSSEGMRFLLETPADWDRAYHFLEAAGDDLSWQRLARVAGRDDSPW